MSIATSLRTVAVSGTLLLGAASLAPSSALAQATDDAAATPPAPAGQNEPYLVATHNDWEIICTTLEADGPEVCEMYQLLVDEDSSPIAEITIAALPESSGLVAGATVTTPLETFLPSGLGWYVGDAEEMRVEGFRVCTVVGCIARMGFSDEEVTSMKRGSHATVVIAPFVAIDQPIEIRVSLMGFTAAMDDLQARLAAAAPAAAPAE